MTLAGLTVLDIASLAAAPQIAAFFADQGARVIKIEPPGGDPLRALVDAQGGATAWKVVNRGKQCIRLDLTQDAGRLLLARMLARADLVVTAHTSERLAALGLDPVSLAATFPRLVLVNLTTFGTRGPWADRAGSGTLAEAAAGLAHLTGAADGPPTLSPVGLGDYLGVLAGITAALSALYDRDAGDGRGRSVDVAMTEPVLGLLGQRLLQVARGGGDPGRHGNRFPTMAPRNAYRAADGRWVALTAGTDPLVRRLFATMARPELADDPRFATNRARVANVDALDAIVGEWIASRPADVIVRALAEARVSAATIDDLPTVLANPHFRARAAITDVSDEELGTLPTAGPLPTGSAQQGIRWLGRALAADEGAVLGQWLGLTPGELATLRANGVI